LQFAPHTCFWAQRPNLDNTTSVESVYFRRLIQSRPSFVDWVIGRFSGQHGWYVPMFNTVMALIRRWQMKTLKPFGPGSPTALRVSLGDTNPEVAQALAAAFDDVHQVEVVEGNLLDLACDAIVSPANSFGDMSGGIDKVIDDFHGGAAQKAVTSAIAEHFFGELPVGAAVVVKLDGRQFPYIVAAPTMRIPGSVAGTINAYLAMRAVLVAVMKHNASGSSPIRSLAIPGLGTGVGGISHKEAGEQMRAAYENVIGGHWRKVVHPAMAPYALGKRRVEWKRPD
jgi:O-acetyl-ADP-ribose deacetylase (regulator of RNase III)